MISIIITAYNAEKTIERCINSILENEYNDYEIIVGFPLIVTGY